MAALEKSVYRFGEFQLEPGERRLSSAGKSISLTPKVFDTLVFLVEHAGHIVTKDELLEAIWPRGFVDESNLTKHVWLIRRALGEGEQQGSRFIETVPKVGYRFVAQVSVTDGADRDKTSLSDANASDPVLALPEVESPVPVEPPTSGGTAPSRRSHYRGGWHLVVAAASILTVAAGLYAYRIHRSTSASAGQSGQSVAFVGFNNLSKNSKDAWLAPALTEMLASELNVVDDLRVIPDELVRAAGADLSPPAAGGYSMQTLADLHRRLDADYVVSGSYLVSGTGEDAPLRVDVALQDARTGQLKASISKQTSLSGLLQLVSGEGSVLRGKLSVQSPDRDTMNRVANAQPPSVDVARRLGFALDALQHYDAARARDELLETIAEAPGYAPAYSYLADAWGALGYRDKEIAAAEQAAQRAAGLPAELRLRIDAVLGNARGDWPKTVEAWRSLSRTKPLDLEYRLRLFDAQLASGSISSAEATLSELSQLPGATTDPRFELAASRAAGVRNDPPASELHANKALENATKRDAAGLVAEARLALGGARMLLGKSEDARGDFLAAIEAYRSIRNPRGEAAARSNLAQTLADLHLNQEAREEYQRAMSLEQSIGDLAGQAGVYRRLCGMLWLAGDRDGAQAAARHALELARQTGDLSMQSWSIQALATVAADDAASDEAIAEYREVVALYERSGHDTAWPLTNIADLQRMRGELAEAAVTCAQARAQAAALSDPQFAIFSGFTCALIEMDRGQTVEARAGFEDVIRLAGKNGDTNYRDNALMMLAQLDMDDKRWKSAEGRLQEASVGFAAAEARTGEADSTALLAMTEHALGDDAASDKALERARTLRASMTSHQEVYAVDIALTALQGRHPACTAAQVGKLLELADDAARRHFLGWSLEAKLVAWDILCAQRGPTAAALRSNMETVARRHGFGRVLNRLSRTDAAVISRYHAGSSQADPATRLET